MVLWNVKMFYDFFSAYICFSLSLMTLPVRDLSIHLKSLSFNVNLKYLEVDMTCCITKYTTHSTWAYKLSNWPLMGGTIKPGLQYEINLYYMGSLFYHCTKTFSVRDTIFLHKYSYKMLILTYFITDSEDLLIESFFFVSSFGLWEQSNVYSLQNILS